MTPDQVLAFVARIYPKSILTERRMSSEDSTLIERYFDCQMPAGFSEFRSLIGIYRIEGGHLPFEEIVAATEIEPDVNPLWDADLIPFYALGNGDYLCLRRSECPESKIYFVPHDEDAIAELHASFDDYLHDPDWQDVGGRKTAQPGAPDNPDDAQRIREDCKRPAGCLVDDSDG